MGFRDWVLGLGIGFIGLSNYSTKAKTPLAVDQKANQGRFECNVVASYKHSLNLMNFQKISSPHHTSRGLIRNSPGV